MSANGTTFGISLNLYKREVRIGVSNGCLVQHIVFTEVERNSVANFCIREFAVEGIRVQPGGIGYFEIEIQHAANSLPTDCIESRLEFLWIIAAIIRDFPIVTFIVISEQVPIMPANCGRDTEPPPTIQFEVVAASDR